MLVLIMTILMVVDFVIAFVSEVRMTKSLSAFMSLHDGIGVVGGDSIQAEEYRDVMLEGEGWMIVALSVAGMAFTVSAITFLLGFLLNEGKASHSFMRLVGVFVACMLFRLCGIASGYLAWKISQRQEEYHGEVEALVF